MVKVAFFVQWLLCGGVENALFALAKELTDRGNDVTIYVITKKGEFLKKVPENVTLKAIPMPEKIRESIPVGGTKVTVRDCISDKKYINALRFAVKHKLSKINFAELNVDLDNIPDLDKNYDIAVNFHIHSPFLVWYLSERVNAKKKLSWIHNDFETTHYDILSLKQYLKCIDRFYAVSQNLVNEFVNIFPEYRDKTDLALNIVPVDEIRKKAEEYYPTEFRNIPKNKMKILTAGRLEEQKGYDIAIDVCKKLLEHEIAFEWFVLGDGTQKQQLLSMIKKFGVQDCFHILGIRSNPYPYFKNCDIYVQTSRHEGYVTTVTEAKIFNRPIVCTDVSGAREQLSDGISGSIAEINAISVFEKIYDLMSNSDIRKSYSVRLEEECQFANTGWLDVFK